MSVLGDNVASLPQREEVEEPETESEPTESEPAIAQRGRSTIAFPYDDLESALAVAAAVHNTYGGQATMAQIAASLGQAAKSGAFRIKASAARLFGLVTVSREAVTLTDLGRRILDPQNEPAARAEAFLKVPLYAEIYNRFKDGTLPDDAGLAVAIAEMGVTTKQVQTSRQVFQRSAEQAGYFRFGNRRLVLPATAPAAVGAGPTVAPEAAPQSERVHRSSREEAGDLVKHPFILGLLRELPDPDDEFSAEARDTWLAAAKIAFDLIYGKAQAPAASEAHMA